MGKIFKRLKTFLLQFKNFGSGIAFAELKSAIFKTPQASYKRYEKIKNYLRAKYSDVIDRYAQLQYVFDETGGVHRLQLPDMDILVSRDRKRSGYCENVHRKRKT